MKPFLLDVNVLIALVDPSHVHNQIALAWFEAEGSGGWATCPITENGFIRILSNPKYPNSPGGPFVVAGLLAQLKQIEGHRFWPDDISLTDTTHFNHDRILSPASLTDSYLLGLAVSKDGVLATLDRRLVSDGVVGGAAALRVIFG